MLQIYPDSEDNIGYEDTYDDDGYDNETDSETDKVDSHSKAIEEEEEKCSNKTHKTEGDEVENEEDNASVDHGICYVHLRYANK